MLPDVYTYPLTRLLYAEGGDFISKEEADLDHVGVRTSLYNSSVAIKEHNWWTCGDVELRSLFWQGTLQETSTKRRCYRKVELFDRQR